MTYVEYNNIVCVCTLYFCVHVHIHNALYLHQRVSKELDAVTDLVKTNSEDEQVTQNKIKT